MKTTGLNKLAQSLVATARKLAANLEANTGAVQAQGARTLRTELKTDVFQSRNPNKNG